MKKKLFPILLAMALCVSLAAPALASDPNDPQFIESITISFNSSEEIYTFQLTNVADWVLLTTINGNTYPYNIYYYEDAKIVTDKDLSTGFMTEENNTFYDDDGNPYESNYYYGEIKAGVLYSVEDIFSKSMEGGGIFGPLHMVPIERLPNAIEWFGSSITEMGTSIYDYELKDTTSRDSSDPQTVQTPVLPVTEGIQVIIDGKVLAFDVQPQIVNGRTLVPLRAIFEEMGAEIEYDGATQTVTATKEDTVVVLTIGGTSPTINGVIVSIDQPGIIVDGRTLAPLRFVAEAFGGSVEWNGDTQTATITK